MDSRASNQMTHSSDNLSQLKPYDGNLQIIIADGGNIPITAIGEISHPLPLRHVFYLSYLPIFYLLDNWLIIIVLSFFLILAVLFKIKHQGR